MMKNDVLKDAKDNYVLTDAKSSVVSNLRSIGLDEKEYKYDADAKRLAAPNTKDTIREVGMSSCDNRLIKSMQLQTFLAWSANIKTEDDLILLFDNGKFKDCSYVLQKSDDGYKLNIKALLVSPQICKDGKFLDADRINFNTEFDQKRDFKEAVSSYTNVEVEFTECSEEDFKNFISKDDLQNNSLKDYKPKDGIYYIPKVVSADYKMYISPSLNLSNLQVRDGTNLEESGIGLVGDSLSLRLEFIAGSLQDALSVKDLDEESKDQHIKYALADLKEIIDSNNFKNQDFASYKSFNNIVNMLPLEKISQDDRIMISNLYSEHHKSKVKEYQSYQRGILGAGAMVCGAITGVGLALSLATPLNVVILAAGVFLMFAIASSYYNSQKQQYHSFMTKIDPNIELMSVGSDAIEGNTKNNIINTEEFSLGNPALSDAGQGHDSDQHASGPTSN